MKVDFKFIKITYENAVRLGLEPIRSDFEKSTAFVTGYNFQ